MDMQTHHARTRVHCYMHMSIHTFRMCAARALRALITCSSLLTSYRFTNVHMHTCARTHMGAHTHRHRQTHTHTHTHSHSHTQTHTHTFTRTHTHTHTHMHTDAHTYTPTQTHTQSHSHTHTHTHAHTHTPEHWARGPKYFHSHK